MRSVYSVEPRPLHTDMVASMILLLGRDELFAAQQHDTHELFIHFGSLNNWLPFHVCNDGSERPGQPSDIGGEFLAVKNRFWALLNAPIDSV